MDSAFAALVQYLRHQRLAVDYMFVSAVSAFIYDYLLTLRLEIKLVWFSPWTYTKFVFLVFRYMSFILLFLILHNQTFSDISGETCKVTYRMQLWSMVLQATLVESILAIRTWAVWNRSKVVGTLLASSIIAGLVPQCVLLYKFIKPLEYDSPSFSGLRGCSVSGGVGGILEGNFTILTAVEAIIFVPLAISAFRSYRNGNNGRLSLIIHRDGILFHVYLLCISIANMAVVFSLPLDMMFLITPLQYSLSFILTTRIILNIRDVGSRGLQTELHTVYDETRPTLTPLEFMRRETLHDNISWSQSLQDSQSAGDNYYTSVGQ